MESVKSRPAEIESKSVRVGASPRGGQSYGIDEPLITLGLAAGGALIVAAGFLGVLGRFEVGPGLSYFILMLGFVVGFTFLFLAFCLYWGSRSWKPRELELLCSALPWGGDELVLDVGCGRGLFSNIVAERVPSGGVVALDLWKKRDLSGNDPKSVMENAEARGTQRRIFLVKADPRFLPFADGVFGAAVSGLAINRIMSAEGRASSLREVVRVLEGGGRLAILVAGAERGTVRVLEKEQLRDMKVSSFRLGLLPPAYSVLARKPFARGD